MSGKALYSGLRIGHGFDVHRRLSETEVSDPANAGRRFVLGGVVFLDETPLVGHSDADVACHAVIDAMLSGAGLGDIGQMFPETNPALAGASGLEMLSQASEALCAAGWRLINADCTVVADSPIIAPQAGVMNIKMSAAAADAPVTVSGKRTEGVMLGGAVPGSAGPDAADVDPSAVMGLASALLYRYSTEIGSRSIRSKRGRYSPGARGRSRAERLRTELPRAEIPAQEIAEVLK